MDLYNKTELIDNKPFIKMEDKDRDYWSKRCDDVRLRLRKLEVRALSGNLPEHEKDSLLETIYIFDHEVVFLKEAIKNGNPPQK